MSGKSLRVAKWRLTDRKLAILSQLSCEPSHLDSAHLKKIEEEITVLTSLAEQIGPRTPSWVLPLGLASFCLLLIGLGSLFHLSATRLELDARSSSVEFVVVKQSDIGNMEDTSPATNFELVGGEKPPFKISAISSISLLAGTRVRVSSVGNGCILLDIPRYPQAQGAPRGARIGIVSPPSSQYPLGNVNEVQLEQGEQARFCLGSTQNYLVLAPVSELAVLKSDRRARTSIRRSSIVSGELRVWETGDTMALDRLSQLHFSDIDNGLLVIFPGDPLHIVFQGKAHVAQQLLLSSDSFRDLRPTYLESVSANPRLKWFFGVFVGLMGTLWTCLRYLGLS